MRELNEILETVENLQVEIDKSIIEVNGLSKVSFKNIIFNREREINKIMYKIYELQGQVNALMWVLR